MYCICMFCFQGFSIYVNSGSYVKPSIVAWLEQPLQEMSDSNDEDDLDMPTSLKRVPYSYQRTTVFQALKYYSSLLTLS